MYCLPKELLICFVPQAKRAHPFPKGLSPQTCHICGLDAQLYTSGALQTRILFSSLPSETTAAIEGPADPFVAATLDTLASLVFLADKMVPPKMSPWITMTIARPYLTRDIAPHSISGSTKQLIG
jgi:hypothetical protein